MKNTHYNSRTINKDYLQHPSSEILQWFISGMVTLLGFFFFLNNPADFGVVEKLAPVSSVSPSHLNKDNESQHIVITPVLSSRCAALSLISLFVYKALLVVVNFFSSVYSWVMTSSTVCNTITALCNGIHRGSHCERSQSVPSTELPSKCLFVTHSLPAIKLH